MTDDVTPGGAAKSSPRRSRSHGVGVFLRDILFILLAAIVVSFLIKTFLVQSFYIPSGSMEQTLQPNDRVLVSLLTPRLTSLQRGDVVVFTDPGGWLTDDTPSTSPSSPITSALAFIGVVPPDDNNHLIKRVIGLPGDHVKCCTVSGKITVNGVAITEPYINQQKAGLPEDQYRFSITVPKGDIWVLGDNRYASEDSAYHFHFHDASPYVPLSDVTGRAFVISWPISRWKYLDDYRSVFARVPLP